MVEMWAHIERSYQTLYTCQICKNWDLGTTSIKVDYKNNWDLGTTSMVAEEDW